MTSTTASPRTGRRRAPRPRAPAARREQRRHAVEEVGDERQPAATPGARPAAARAARAVVRSRRRCGRARPAIPSRASADGSRVGARALRGPRHLRDGAGPRLQHQVVEQLEVGVDERGRVLRAAPHRRQERTLEVYAGQLAVADQRRAGAHTGEQALRRGGDEGARRPWCVPARWWWAAAVRRAVGVGTELPAAAAVAVDVDQAREQREARAPPVRRGGAPPLRRQGGARTGIRDAVAGDDDGAVGARRATGSTDRAREQGAASGRLGARRRSRQDDGPAEVPGLDQGPLPRVPP